MNTPLSTISDSDAAPAPALRLCVLASGSAGNCTYIETDHDALLIDAGLSAKETLRRLLSLNLDPAKIRAICITHEHSDHIRGVPRLHKLLQVPLYANSATAHAVKDTTLADWHCITNGSDFRIGDFDIRPFSLPHDAYDPVGYRVACGSIRIGIATDLGIPTALIRETLRGCHALVLEANHDEDLLRDSPRPWRLKQRILGSQGHLSNATAADLLAEIAGDTLQEVFLAHLSQECNREELALTTVRNRLNAAGLGRIQIHAARPDTPTLLYPFF